MEREAKGQHTRGGVGVGGGATTGRSNGQPDLLLQWGNSKRLRCVKIQVKNGAASSAGEKITTVRVDRRVFRSDKEPPPPPPSTHVLRRPSPHRILRNSETAAAMRSPQRQINGFAHMTSPERGGGAAAANHKINNKVGAVMCSEEKKGGSSSGSEGMVWPKFVISLTNKEKEEDFQVFKGCNKLPQRPKKRAKCIQRTLNLVCPGSWLCDLTQERYEVREKKVSKKRPRGLKAMGSMESDSE